MITGKEKRKSYVFFLCQKIHLFKKILLSWLNSDQERTFLINKSRVFDRFWLIEVELKGRSSWPSRCGPSWRPDSWCSTPSAFFTKKDFSLKVRTLPLCHFTSLLVHHYTTFKVISNSTNTNSKMSETRQIFNSTWHKLEILKIIVEENYKEDLHNLSYKLT